MSRDRYSEMLPHDRDVTGDGQKGNRGGFDVCKAAPLSLVIPQPAVPGGESIRVRMCLHWHEEFQLHPPCTGPHSAALGKCDELTADTSSPVGIIYGQGTKPARLVVKLASADGTDKPTVVSRHHYFPSSDRVGSFGERGARNAAVPQPLFCNLVRSIH